MLKKTKNSFLNANKINTRFCCTEVCNCKQTSCAQSGLIHFDIKNKVLIFSLIFCFFMILGVYANVNYLTNTIYTNYSAGDTINGNVYLTLANHPSDELFTSNFLGNITLLDLIINSQLNEGVNYNCSTVGCSSDYSPSGVITDVSLTSGEESFIGFKVNGPGISVTNVEFKVASNSQSSCTPNLYIDILDDDSELLTNTQSSGQSCGVRHTGCYQQSNNAETSILNDREFCETITIPASPSFIVGGEIRMGTGASNLTMKLYDSDIGLSLGNCKLPQHSAQQGLQDLNCVINHSSSESNEYYVCITTSINNNYKIGWETSSPTCGTAQGFNSFNSDFDLFAETMQYSASPNFVINETSYDEMFDNSLSEAIDAYIENRYNRNCQNGCYIPIKLFGGNQFITLNDAKLNYESFGVPGESNDIYGLTYDSAKITARNLSLNVSKANFVIPVDTNQNKFKLYLDDDLLFQKDISIRRSFAFDITPKVVAFGQNVNFRALSTTTNITRSTWNFGDGTVKTVNGSQAFHTYTSRNNSFDITVTAINNNSLQATKQFRVFVGNPKDIANQTIREYRKRVVNLTSQINLYPVWVIPSLQNIVRVSNLTSRINSIELDYLAANSETAYQDVMVDLIQLDVPSSISTLSSGNDIPLSVGYESVNVNYLEQIENKDVTDNTQLTEQVIGWMNDHFNPEISFKKIARVGDFDTEPIATIFIIKTNPTDLADVKTYLILGQDVEVSGEYKTNYNVESISAIGIDYIVLDNSQNQIFEFMVEGDIEAETLGAYIAPSLDAINSIEGPSGECNINNRCESNESEDSCPEDCSRKWFRFTLVSWIVLLVAGFIVYIILQEWYKKNYQKHLFPENNDLYNLVNFIYNARKSGLSDSEIRSKLHQQKWSGERITFAFRKIEGKRVTMFEIPIFTWREHKKTITQISNRQNSPVDARFIKRPSFT